MEEPDLPDIPLARPVDLPWRPEREMLRLDDGYETPVYLHWPRTERRRYPVVYLHGIQSHPGWFVGSAAHLAGEGFPVVQVTRRGSGSCPCQRGHANGPKQLLRDVASACRRTKERFDADRVHLVGVSWGGKLAACFAAEKEYASSLATLTMIAPGIVAQVDVSAGMKLAVAAALFWRPKKRFPIPLNEVELFTDNPEMQRYLQADTSRLYEATAKFLFTSRLLDARLAKAAEGAISCPASLLLSSRDRIIQNDATRKALMRLAGRGLEVREFSGSHTLEFEADPIPFYRGLAETLIRRENLAR